MSIEEMESALRKFSGRRPPISEPGSRPGGAPYTARSLLEDNKRLIAEKEERRALEKQHSREFVEAVLAQDRVTTEGDKAREITRRNAQRELAKYYKTKIAEKEMAKAEAYQEKVKSGAEIHYFPFVEGENITRSRQAQSHKQREEMRSFLKQQREANPPRMDSLLYDVDHEYNHKYPEMPHNGIRANSMPPPTGGGALASTAVPVPPGGPPDDAGEDVAPHMARPPRFLSRAHEHMSRRLHDDHVRKALEDKVRQTKDELEAAKVKRQSEAAQLEDGILVNDALRYDSRVAKAADRRKNAEFLQSQMRERKSKMDDEAKERRAEPAGYWGPEEKEMQDEDMHRVHCHDLITQMEVNQSRRLDSRHRRLRQERRLVDNSMAAMSMDRDKERQKYLQHREVLTTTWQSQQRIRDAMTRIENL